MMIQIWKPAEFQQKNMLCFLISSRYIVPPVKLNRRHLAKLQDGILCLFNTIRGTMLTVKVNGHGHSLSLEKLSFITYYQFPTS